MLIHSNNKPIRILGLGFVAHGICQYLLAENVPAECIDVDTALADDRPECYQYLIGTVRKTGVRQQIVEWLVKNNLNSPSFIHPQSIVAEKVDLGHGIICYPFSLIFKSTLQNYITIGPHCHIGHNCHINTGTVLLPYSFVLGSSVTGNFTVLQTKSNLIDHVTITAEYVNILPGSMVTKNIDVSGTYGGTPARFISSKSSLTSNYFT
jgi:acetyltransferase-like isoleucine patch superfamily enzyme